MTPLALAAVLPLLWTAPAVAQPMDMKAMPGMSMPGTTHPQAKPARTQRKAKTHRTPRRAARHAAEAGMASMPMSHGNAAHGPAASPDGAHAGATPAPGHQGMAGMTMSGQPGQPGQTPAAGSPAGGAMPGLNMPSNAVGVAGMNMAPQAGEAAATPAEPSIPNMPPPLAAKDHLADLHFDPAAMAEARHMMRTEMGGSRVSKIMLNLAEYQTGAKGDGYRWDGQAWFGGDLNRLVLRSEGEGSVKDGLETGEVQALYSRAVGRYLDVQGGVRQDVSPQARTYLTVGAQSLFPYWFDVEGALFLSTKGELLARAEGTYDLRLFQRVVLQPRAELNFAAQNTPETRTGSGLSNAELGLRLRYEIRREFAPYIGVSWDRRLGRTADYWRAAGESPESTTFVVGVRTWF